MSGHSKWANIKHRKGAQDKKRGKAFTKIIKEITIAAREGGPDINFNPRLRLAVQNAKGVNLPKDTVERAIKKATGADSENYIETTYEGYGPNGIAIFAECTTDNLNRTVASVRSLFNKYGGSLGTNGSLSFLFNRKGIFSVPASLVKDADDFMMEIIDAGAEDVELQEEAFVITTSMEDFGAMQKKLEEMNIEAESAQLERVPETTIKLEVEQAKKVMKLIEALEEDDDVQNVYHNLELTEELIDAIQ